MADELKEPVAGEPKATPEPEPKGNLEPVAKEPKGEPKPGAGQPKYVTEDEYKNLQRLVSRKDTEITELRKQQEEFQDKMKTAFGTQAKTPDGGGFEDLSPTEARNLATKYREAGDLDTARMLVKQATLDEKLAALEANNNTTSQLSVVYAELSKEDSLIDPKTINWDAVGKIAERDKVNVKAALGTYLYENINTVVAPIREKEKQATMDSLRAKGMVTDYEPVISDKEKEQLAKEHDEIGDPRFRGQYK